MTERGSSLTQLLPAYPVGTTLLSAADAVVEFTLPKEAGADGLIWWGGNEGISPDKTAAFWAHTAHVTGPLVRKLVSENGTVPPKADDVLTSFTTG